MSELSSYSHETGALFAGFFDRYKSLFANSNPPDYFIADSEKTVVKNFLHHIETEGPKLVLYHGTHSGHIDNVAPRKLYPPFYLAVNPFQSAQYALQRAWTENDQRRLAHAPAVDPVLYEIHMDLRGLDYEIIHPSPYANVTKNIGIGVNTDLEDPTRNVLFEVQLIGQKAENRLKAGKVDIVASGSNLFQLLRWSQQHIGSFPMDILLPR